MTSAHGYKIYFKRFLMGGWQQFNRLNEHNLKWFLDKGSSTDLVIDTIICQLSAD